jgi:uncharacterized surface protein with fasciclin (FAS1) repeats
MRNSTRIAATVASAGLIAAAMAAPASARPAAPSPTIVDIAVGSGVHTTLVAAVVYTGLDGVLSGRGQFTVFAPTDAAFGAINAGNIATIFPGEKGKADLTNILLYHVAPGERFASDVLSSSKVRMMNKSFAAVEGATIDGAAISWAGTPGSPLDASNGVVHVIDELMMP